ncbi:hypothetical protein B7P43_G16033 [Cryptotermes secundus]|uniref:PHD-type domain-containing protein n=1 Tax=Cryptotermes secundus TaxID=105785 RepID=A0A2J7PDU0_9NEOP|nr:hypothetical protein B7P43_G16033 [Cryptotermes secundus]
MCCYLEDYRARVGNCAARTPNGQARSYIGNMLLGAATLAIVLVIGGVEQNTGPVVEAENILQVLCSGCERNLKSGTQCDTCGRWFHNSCGNVRAQMAESGKWSCERCRWGRLRQLEEKLENVMKQIEELKRKNSALEDQLRGAVARGDTVQRQQDAECLVLGDSIIRNVEAEHMRVQCFPGIRTEQLQRVIDNRDLGAPDTVVIHVGTNDLRRPGNLDYVMGDVYALVKKAKTKFPQATLVLSGVLRRRDVTWRNLIDTFKPDIIIGTESWLREEISNAEVFRDEYTTFRRDRNSRGGGVFICVKNYIAWVELWVDEDFEMIAVEVKGRDPKCT